MMIFGVYLLIRKRAVLRYIRRLLAAYRLSADKHVGILTYYQKKSTKKTDKNALFCPPAQAGIRQSTHPRFRRDKGRNSLDH